MTNPYFDQAKASPYRGGFELCPVCVTVVPAAYKDRHAVECDARHEAAEAEHEPAIVVADVEWDDRG